MKAQISKLLLYLVKNSTWIALLAITIFWCAFFFKMGTPSSGFHFTDDHEVIRIEHELETSSVGEVIGKWAANDFNIRFRPFFYVERVALTALTGSNYGVHSAYHLVILILTSWLSYLILRSFKFSTLLSLVFSIIWLVGPQTEIWWRLGAAEAPGAFCSMLGVFLLISSYKHPKKKTLLKAVSLVPILIAVFFKESFLVLIPALVLLDVILHRSFAKGSWKQAILANFAWRALLLVICAISVYIVFKVIGTAQIGYAGIETSSFSIRRLGSVGLQLFANEYRIILSALVLALIVKTILWTKKLKFFSTQSIIARINKQKWHIALLLLFTAAILAPELIMHAKSGFAARYIIPAILGFWFIALMLTYVFVERLNFVKYRRLFELAAIAIITLAFIPTTWATYKAGKQFAVDGYYTNEAIQMVTKSVLDKDGILIVANTADHYEATFSLYHYLTQKEDYSNLTIFPIVSASTAEDSFKSGLSNAFLETYQKELFSSEKASVFSAIFIFTEQEQPFLDSSREWFDAEQYERYNNPLFTVYTLID